MRVTLSGLLTLHFLFGGVLVGGSVYGQVEPPKEKSTSAKQVMAEIYSALRALLPYSLTQKEVADPKIKEELSKQFKILADSASILPEHTEFHDATFRYLGNSLARETKEMQRQFENGNIEDALSLVDVVTDNCVACHTRLPAQQSAKAANLFADFDSQSLMLEEKARLYLVTRQFDKSIETFKEVILSDNYKTEDICLANWIEDYLTIAVRVKRELADAKYTLVRFQRRSNVPAYVQHDLKTWTEALEKLEKRKDLKPTLPSIRKLMQEARAQLEFPMDRDAQIHYLLASSLLHEFVLSNPKGSEGAEAYYLLGVTESATGRSAWLAQNEYYLETAIRLAPSSQFAEKAYRELEGQIFYEYSGSAGTYVPEEIKKLLADLREVMATAKKKKS